MCNYLLLSLLLNTMYLLIFLIFLKQRDKFSSLQIKILVLCAYLSERDLHKECDKAQNYCQRNIDISTREIPQLAA